MSAQGGSAYGRSGLRQRDKKEGEITVRSRTRAPRKPSAAVRQDAISLLSGTQNR